MASFFLYSDAPLYMKKTLGLSAIWGSTMDKKNLKYQRRSLKIVFKREEFSLKVKFNSANIESLIEINTQTYSFRGTIVNDASLGFKFSCQI